MIVDDPVATEVTRPTSETVATVESDVVQLTVAPDISLPPASSTVTLNVAVSPCDAKLSVSGVTATDAAT